MSKSKPLPMEYILTWFQYCDGYLFRADHGFAEICLRKYSDGRGCVWIIDQLYLTYRVIWAVVYKKDPGPFVIDHKDGDVTNNKIDNLRLATNQINALNRQTPKWSRSGKVGVQRNGSSWRASITLGGTEHYIGTFKRKKDAIAARTMVEQAYWNALKEN